MLARTHARTIVAGTRVFNVSVSFSGEVTMVAVDVEWRITCAFVYQHISSVLVVIPQSAPVWAELPCFRPTQTLSLDDTITKKRPRGRCR
jgi:hypothetical protein